MEELFESFFDFLYDSIIIPALHLIDTFLNLLISPLSGYPPLIQILVVAVFGALLSRILSNKFKAGRKKELNKEFQEKISSLKYTKYVGDNKLRRIVRKGINQSADETYEKIILDKFFETGISYFLPLFFFLIWLEYSLFTPETLISLTGSPYAYVRGSEVKLSAAWVYLYSYNIILAGLCVIKLIVRFVSGMRKTLRQKSK